MARARVHGKGESADNLFTHTLKKNFFFFFFFVIRSTDWEDALECRSTFSAAQLCNVTVLSLIATWPTY